MCWKSFVSWTRHFRCVKIWCRNSKRSINNFQVTCSPNKYNGQFRTPIQFHFMIIYTKYFFNLLNKFFKMAQIVSFFDYFMLRNNLTNIPTRKFFNNVFNLTNFRFRIYYFVDLSINSWYVPLCEILLVSDSLHHFSNPQ